MPTIPPIPPTRVRLVFRSKYVINTTTFEDAEKKLRDLQFGFFWDTIHFRETILAAAQEDFDYDMELDPYGDSRDFLFECERAGLFNLAIHY